MFRRPTPTYTLFSIASDIAFTFAALALARTLRDIVPIGAYIPGEVPLSSPVALLIVLIWQIVFFIFSVYDPRRTARLLDEVQSVLTASVFALLALAGGLYFTERNLSRLLIIYFFCLCVAGLIGWRVVYWVLIGQRSLPTRKVLIIGANELGSQMAEMLSSPNYRGLQVIGFIDDAPELVNVPLLGGLGQAYDIAKSEQIDEVIITLPYRDYEKLNDLILALHSLPLQVRIAPNYLNLVLYRAAVEDFGGVPLINLRDTALTPYQRVVKRAFDLLIGSTTLILTLPLWLLIGIAIRLDSHGPVFFRQQRVGENGKLFTMIKFRTMVEDAEARQHEVVTHDADGNFIYKTHADPRVTRVGRWLRRTSLDELPNLINVLRGEMSLVGPRPEVTWMMDKYAAWQLKRFAVPQGMTGWWQVNGRSDKPMHLHTEDDLYYIQNYSMLLDIVILWRTIFAVLRRKGAY
ncbi:MAG: sugar transferase [Anaerolineae bacterium]